MAPEQTNKLNMGEEKKKKGKEEKCKPELKREETTEQQTEPQQKTPHNQNSTAKSEAWKDKLSPPKSETILTASWATLQVQTIFLEKWKNYVS